MTKSALIEMRPYLSASCNQWCCLRLLRQLRMHCDGDDDGDVGCSNALLLRPLRGSRSLLVLLVVGHFVGCSNRRPSFARRRFPLVDMAVENRAALGIPCLTTTVY